MDDSKQEIRGRRLDIAENNALVVVQNPNARAGRNFAPQARRPTPTGDKDMLDYVRQEEQKLKLEKLKWHETNARIKSLSGALKPSSSLVSNNASHSKSLAGNLPLSSHDKKHNAHRRAVPASGESKPVATRDMALAERLRNKEASKWLHKEQEEIKAKRKELLQNKLAARELETRRRLESHFESEGKVQRQLRLLAEDPDLQDAASELVLRAPQLSDIRASPGRYDRPQQRHRDETKNMDNTEIAPEDMPLPAQLNHSFDSRGGLELKEKLNSGNSSSKPAVPRLSKAFVNRNSLVGSTLSHPELLPFQKRPKQKTEDESSGASDVSDYSCDEDFENGNAGRSLQNANEDLIGKVLGPPLRKKRPSTKEEEEEEEENDAKNMDHITKQYEESIKARRKEGKSFAKKKRLLLARQEQEAAAKKKEAEDARKLALEQLRREALQASSIPLVVKKKDHVDDVPTGSAVETVLGKQDYGILNNEDAEFATFSPSKEKPFVDDFCVIDSDGEEKVAENHLRLPCESDGLYDDLNPYEIAENLGKHQEQWVPEIFPSMHRVDPPEVSRTVPHGNSRSSGQKAPPKRPLRQQYPPPRYQQPLQRQADGHVRGRKGALPPNVPKRSSSVPKKKSIEPTRQNFEPNKRSSSVTRGRSVFGGDAASTKNKGYMKKNIFDLVGDGDQHLKSSPKKSRPRKSQSRRSSLQSAASRPSAIDNDMVSIQKSLDEIDSMCAQVKAETKFRLENARRSPPRTAPPVVVQVALPSQPALGENLAATIRNSLSDKLSEKADELFVPFSKDTLESMQRKELLADKENVQGPQFGQLSVDDWFDNISFKNKMQTMTPNLDPLHELASDEKKESTDDIVHDDSVLRNPLFDQQLGLMVDRQRAVKKFHSQTDAMKDVNPTPDNHSSSGYYVKQPSLRNVGELSSLVSTRYATQDGDDSDDVSDNESSKGGDSDNDYYDGYSALAIYAAQQMEFEEKTMKNQQDFTPKQYNFPVHTKEERRTAQTVEVTRKADPSPAEETKSEDAKSFWDLLLEKPIQQSNGESVTDRYEIATTEDLVRDYILESRGQQSISDSDTPHQESTQITVASRERFSPEEMRIRMMEELRRQDDIFTLTMELVDVEKQKTVQSAKDLAQQAHQQSATALLQLQQDQDTEIQRLAYETALATSVANSRIQDEQKSALQQQELMAIQAQTQLHELEHEYQMLLQKAAAYADKLENNRQFVEIEKQLTETKAQEIVGNILQRYMDSETIHVNLTTALEQANTIASDAAHAAAVSAESAASAANAAAAANQALVSNLPSTTTITPGIRAVPKARKPSPETSSFDGYSNSFEAEASHSLTFNKEESTLQPAHVSAFSMRSEYQSAPNVIAESDEPIGTDIGESGDYGSNEEGENKTKHGIIHASDEIEDDDYGEDFETEAGSSKRSSIREQSQSSANSVPMDAPEVNHSSGTFQSSNSKSISSNDHVGTSKATLADVPRRLEPRSVDSVYSDTFDSSGGTKAPSLVHSGRDNFTAAADAGESSLRMMTLHGSDDIDAAMLDDNGVQNIIVEYRKEMEARLRGQEKTHKMRVKFLKVKQLQRLKQLQHLKDNDKNITAAMIKEEQQRVEDTYQEERAELERERWALNARAYKELRKFKQLKKDLIEYKINLADPTVASQKLNLDLLGRSGGKAGYRDEKGDVYDSYDSFSTSTFRRDQPEQAVAMPPRTTGQIGRKYVGEEVSIEMKSSAMIEDQDSPEIGDEDSIPDEVDGIPVSIASEGVENIDYTAEFSDGQLGRSESRGGDRSIRSLASEKYYDDEFEDADDAKDEINEKSNSDISENILYSDALPSTNDVVNKISSNEMQHQEENFRHESTNLRERGRSINSNRSKSEASVSYTDNDFEDADESDTPEHSTLVRTAEYSPLLKPPYKEPDVDGDDDDEIEEEIEEEEDADADVQGQLAVDGAGVESFPDASAGDEAGIAGVGDASEDLMQSTSYAQDYEFEEEEDTAGDEKALSATVDINKEPDVDGDDDDDEIEEEIEEEKDTAGDAKALSSVLGNDNLRNESGISNSYNDGEFDAFEHSENVSRGSAVLQQPEAEEKYDVGVEKADHSVDEGSVVEEIMEEIDEDSANDAVMMPISTLQKDSTFVEDLQKVDSPTHEKLLAEHVDENESRSEPLSDPRKEFKVESDSGEVDASVLQEKLLEAAKPRSLNTSFDIDEDDEKGSVLDFSPRIGRTVSLSAAPTNQKGIDLDLIFPGRSLSESAAAQMQLMSSWQDLDEEELGLDLPDDTDFKSPGATATFSGDANLPSEQSDRTMYYDKEQQRWIGGDDINLDGFEDSDTESLEVKSAKPDLTAAKDNLNDAESVEVLSDIYKEKENRDSPISNVSHVNNEKDEIFEKVDTGSPIVSQVDDYDEDEVLLPSAPSGRGNLIKQMGSSSRSGIFPTNDKSNAQPAITLGNVENVPEQLQVSSPAGNAGEVRPSDDKTDYYFYDTATTESSEEGKEKSGELTRGDDSLQAVEEEVDIEDLLDEIESVTEDKDTANELLLSVESIYSTNLSEQACDLIETSDIIAMSEKTSSEDVAVERQADMITDKLVANLIDQTVAATCSQVTDTNLLKILTDNISKLSTSPHFVQGTDPYEPSSSADNDLDDSDFLDREAEQLANEMILTKPHLQRVKPAPLDVAMIDRKDDEVDEDSDLYDFSDPHASISPTLHGPVDVPMPHVPTGEVAASVTAEQEAVVTAQQIDEECNMILEDTKSFLGHLLAEQNLEQQLADPQHQGIFVPEIPPSFDGSSDNINKEALLDRVNEYISDLHAARHDPLADEVTGVSKHLDPQRFLATTMPLNNEVIVNIVKEKILSEQRKLTDVMRGKVSAQETVNTECMDDFKQETERAIADSCSQMADTVLARCLVEIIAEVEQQQDIDLSSFLKP